MKRWRQPARADTSSKRIVLCESAIDAISCFQLQPCGACAVQGRDNSPGTVITHFGLERKGNEMKRFMLLHYGFEKPTPEIMEAWEKWFQSIDDRMADRGGFHGQAKEISSNGAKDLPMASDSITGFNIINAESFEEAERMAQSNPYIASIRVYEIM
jgi:hypothetical protein